MNFSVLMSVYIGTKATDLNDCFISLRKQTKPATEVLVIKDGPVSQAVDKCIDVFSDSLPIRSIDFPTNRGLGPALRDGLSCCRYDIVARVDSDDICVPDRFDLQIKYLETHPDVAALGGALRERYSMRTRVVSVVRNGPLAPAEIARRVKFRNPLNHQTTMLRKNIIEKCGSYDNFPLFEDYHLWIKLIRQNYNLANLDSILVETTIDTDYMRRRGGLTYIQKELAVAKYFFSLRYFSLIDVLIFIITRLPLRLVPTNVRLKLYKTFLRKQLL